jgi:hypothetical protein
MADKSSIVNRITEQKKSLEESLYRSNYLLSGDSSYFPLESVDRLKGPVDLIATLRTVATVGELSNLVESLVTRVLSLEADIQKLKVISGGKSK